MQVYVHVHIRPFSVVSSKHSPGPPVLPLERFHPGPSLPHLAPDASCEVSAGVGSSSTPHSAVCTKTADLVGCFGFGFFISNWRHCSQRQQHIQPQEKRQNLNFRGFSPFFL